MNRKQFMEQLERLLSDISEAERQEALEYYEGYFDDAGPENEGEVIRELGNPGKVAAIIKADLQENSEIQKISKTAGKDVPSAAITQRKSRIRQESFLR